MGDQQHRHVELGFEVEQQLQDLRLDGHVERRGRLVRDEKVWFVGERHGDHNALPLTAGELMRVGCEPRLRILDADLVEKVDHARFCGAVGKPAMNFQNLADLVFDRVQRIERRHRLLKDHRNLVAADSPERFGRKLHQILALKLDHARWVRGGRVGQQAQDRERGHRLARAGFSDESHRLALADLEGGILHRMHDLAAGMKIDRQILDPNQSAALARWRVGFFLVALLMTSEPALAPRRRRSRARFRP